jgi:hypothetical protein
MVLFCAVVVRRRLLSGKQPVIIAPMTEERWQPRAIELATERYSRVFRPLVASIETYGPRRFLVTGHSTEGEAIQVKPGGRRANQMMAAFTSLSARYMQGATLERRINRCAQAWGPLGLCKHRLPAAHHEFWDAHHGLGKESCVPLGSNDPAFGEWCQKRYRSSADVWTREPVDAWMFLADRAIELIGVAGDQSESRATMLQWWLSIAGARPVVRFDGSDMVMEWGYDHADPFEGPLARWDPLFRDLGCFRALTAQLLWFVMTVRGRVECFYCRRIFQAGRRPHQGERPCCGDAACLRAKARQAQKRFRRRDKAEDDRMRAMVSEQAPPR